MWSIHPLNYLKPVCSFLSVLSPASVILDIMILQNILLGMENKVLPLQLLQFVSSPDFWDFYDVTLRPAIRYLFIFQYGVGNWL